MNKKQLIDAINKYPFLNDKQKDVLIYFVLISLDIPGIPYSINTTISHISEVTQITINQTWRAIDVLKKKKLVIEIESYKNKTYKLDFDEIKRMLVYRKLQNNCKTIAKQLQNN